MAVERQVAGGVQPLPEWLQVLVPVEEMSKWVRFVGEPGGFDKPALYLLGSVLDAYGWEQGIVWTWDQWRWQMQARHVEGVSSWGESVVKDVQRAMQSWDGVVLWLERRPDTTAALWLDWVATRKQQLTAVGMQVCQECACWYEQWSYALPRWLLVALGLVPGGMESISWLVEGQQ